jgi:hypothetical protein
MGPFDPEDHRVEDANVIFLIVQGKGKDSAVVKGVGKWIRGENDDKWVSEAFSRKGTLPNGSQRDLRSGEIARGIALALVIRPGSLSEALGFPSEDGSQSGGPTEVFDPPQIEGVTWCADFMFT